MGVDWGLEGVDWGFAGSVTGRGRRRLGAGGGVQVRGFVVAAGECREVC